MGLRGIADGDVQFVGGDDAELRIAILPPELVADDDHIERAGGLGMRLGAEDDAGRGEEQHDHDQDRE